MSEIYSILEKDDFITTLKETSVDKTKKTDEDGRYMTMSTIQAINFDDVKDFYVKDLAVPLVPKSNDALVVVSDSEAYFVEFKNGEIDISKNYQIKIKIYDSLLLLLDLIEKNISFSRENLHYILVYNEDIKHTSSQFDKNEAEKVKKQFSPHRDKIVKRVNNLAAKKYIQFGLEKFERLYFKSVSTYTKKQFEQLFIKKIETS
ncbi:hypothetical protein DW944_10000 [Eubacterium ventriosum]|uniref:Uncharacterized protein n=1 Tax=Eubacterium ventriosum TaxID=39496 RepID=A0A413R5Z3_9FIRM|nr:hypothetical protein [Eubacterium ventriosum]RHA17253.1 hypothetical protein DW944_10000 [Eubacterium ventriosum]RHB18890.1 hypothetical protein DW893_02665 [Eubacterium ventriosum]